MNNIEIMGVLNITDNSFHDGGKYNSLKVFPTCKRDDS